MFIDRRIERHQLPYFLRVFNGVTDKPIGFLGNVSEEGLMLISHLPLMIGASFELRLKIPAADDCPRFIDLKACCLWCHEDATPHHYDAGFSLQWAPVEYGELVGALRGYFSFRQLPASA
ncbi:PilZ domain-containing protein [Pseudomonas sp. TMB3-21]